jgi:hypothetical protein
VAIFFLGTHQTDWIGRAAVPLFLSHRRLKARNKFPVRPLDHWALDSGGFSELSLFGKWETTPADYIRAVRGYTERLGAPMFAAPQDWMVEDVMLKRTGLSMEEHQRRTVQSFLDLRHAAPEVPWIPVLQGWTPADYLRCTDLYAKAGVNLAGVRVGVGTMCRRQGTTAAIEVLSALQPLGAKLHGFGFKSSGLVRAAPLLASADSMAWSFHARKQRIQLPGHTHQTCANCMTYALQWRGDLMTRLPEPWRLE